MAICEKGLKQAELEKWRDVAKSTKEIYGNLKSALGPILEKINEMKICVDEAKKSFCEGYVSEGNRKKEIDTDIDSIKQAIDLLIRYINEHINQCEIRRTFYNELKENAENATSSVNNKYDVTDIDYKWYEGGSLREAGKINKTLKKKNKVRFDINGSYVEIHY